MKIVGLFVAASLLAAQTLPKPLQLNEGGLQLPLPSQM